MLERGGLVAFPTETVYGLGARADDAAAVRRIFEAKGRPPTNPLIVHVASIDAARGLALRWPDAAERLAQAFWPGPLTLIVDRRDGTVADEVTAFGDSVALRVPAHGVARALLGRLGWPVVAPSANRSTTVSPTTADHVLSTLGGRIEAVIDGGATGHADGSKGLFGIESTIVDVRREPVRVLRHGAIANAAIGAHLNVVSAADLIADPAERALAPGSHALHYSPKARLVVVAAEHVFDEIITRRARRQCVGVIQREPGTGFDHLCERLPREAAGYAACLYAALHRLDAASCDAIVVEAPPSGDEWLAVWDRLRRASATAP